MRVVSYSPCLSGRDGANASKRILVESWSCGLRRCPGMSIPMLDNDLLEGLIVAKSHCPYVIGRARRDAAESGSRGGRCNGLPVLAVPMHNQWGATLVAH